MQKAPTADFQSGLIFRHRHVPVRGRTDH